MKSQELRLGVDYYIDQHGRFVFTASFLKRRGYCCGNGCRHCPYSEEEYLAAKRKRRMDTLLG